VTATHPDVRDTWEGSTSQPPQDIQAEQSVLGGMLLSVDAIAAVRRTLDAADFYRHDHQAVYGAIVDVHGRGEPADAITVAAELERRGVLSRIGGAPYLHTLIATVPVAGNAGYYAEIVAEKAGLRRRREHAQRVLQQIDAGLDLEHISLTDSRERVRPKHGPQPVEFDDFLDADVPEYDWLVPGLLERADRLLLTGPEGGGKSTLLRQLAVQFASGVHPFGGEPFEPVTVLLLDVENSERQVYRALRPLRIQAGTLYPRGRLKLMIRPEGLALATDDRDRAWFTDTIDAVRPDIVIGGPAYKLSGGDPNSEEDARAVAAIIDKVRASVGCAFVTEAHSPHASNGGKRPTRPYGASLWLRWPEFGLHLNGGPDGDGALTHWRGPRDERDWPAMLQRGGDWPWTVNERPRDMLWSRIQTACMSAGERLSVRALADQLGSTKSTVQRVVDEHRADWELLG
jgi:replicative DNA helicase